jgi:nucleoside-diphosphate-sugar epimerase
MNVGLTGATGAVGSAVLAHVARAGAQVRSLVRRRDATPMVGGAVVGSLADRAALEALATGADVVVHCAAALSDDPAECRRTNVEGTRNVAEAARSAGAKLVHVSTASVYDHARARAFDEGSPLVAGPPDDYGRSKAEAERVIGEVARGGLRSVILRPVVVLSMHPRSYWGPLALARARSEPGPIVPFAEVPYVHVDNLAEAVVLAAASDAAVGRAYDVIDGYGPAGEYLRAIAAAVGRPAASLPPDAPTFRYAGDRIRAELGYAPADRWSEFLSQLAAARAG